MRSPASHRTSPLPGRLGPWLGAVLLLASGCSLKSMVVGQTAGLIPDLNAGLKKGVSYEVARRGIPGSLLQIDGFLEVRPDDPRLLVAGAEGYASYAFGFVEDEDPAEAVRLYARARDDGLRALRLHSDFERAWEAEKHKDAIQTLGADSAPALFWTAYAWGSLINLTKDDPRSLFALPTVQAMVDRAAALAPTFNHDGPLLLQASLVAGTPAMAGGGPEKARPEFERVLKDWGGKFLLADYAYAKLYAVPLQDEGLFTATLQKILDAPDDVLPDETLANQIAKARARWLLAHKERFF